LFKALSCDTTPDFTTIASFVSEHSAAISDLFEQVVLVCHEQGLIGHNLIAIDGCKLPSNAAKEWSGTLEELAHKRDKLRKQIDKRLEEHKALDKLGDAAESDRRQKKVRHTVDTLSKAHDKLTVFLDTASPRMGNAKKPKEVKSNFTDNESCKMKTSKGTIQGYNGIATVDSKHQIIIDAEAVGYGQEQPVFKPVLERIKCRYQRLGVSDNIYKQGLIVTADTGYSNQGNVEFVRENEIDGYVPDNQFRRRDPAFEHQKAKHVKNKPTLHKSKRLFEASEFIVDVKKITCLCPAGESLPHKNSGVDQNGNEKLYFKGRLSQCRNCTLKHQCMRRPEAADTRTGHGRQVSFIVLSKGGKNHPSRSNGCNNW